MNALDEIVKRAIEGKKLTEIELAIHWVWYDTGTKKGIAYEAAVANAAMQARIEKLEKHMQEAIDNCETCHGSVDCARCKTFERDLKGDE